MKTIYINGQVYTGTLPLVQAFVVEGDEFLDAGSNEDMLKLQTEGDEVVDLKEQFVMCGFNDSHMHVTAFGNFLTIANLGQHTESLQDLVAHMKDFLANHPVDEGHWLRGWGWNQDFFQDVDRMPTRYDLDEISTEIPIMVTRACGHVAVINSKAIELLNLTEDTPDPDGGVIGKQDGKLDGILYEHATGLASNQIPVPDKNQIKEMIALSCKTLNSFGITSAQSDDYSLSGDVHFSVINEAFHELIEEGKLTVRIYEQSNLGSLEKEKEFIEAGFVTGVGDEMFKIGPFKIISDGTLGARTAFMAKPYADDPTTTGVPIYTAEEMNEMIGYANAHKMNVAVHAIGDGALDRTLDAIELALKENPWEDHRHGIVHCQISRQDQLDRIADMKLHVFCQSIFLDYDSHIVEDRVGKELASTSYNWKTLMNKGVSVSNGSDCPVEMPNVMAGMQCAVRRRPLKEDIDAYLPEQAFTVQEVLDSYTIKGAEGSFEENRKGQIKKGMLADFVVLGQNPFEVAPNKIKDIPVNATYLGGKCVFAK